MKKTFLVLTIIFLCNPIAVFALGAPPIDISYNDGIYHIVLKGDKIKKRVRFVASDHLVTNREMHQMSRARLTVNSGIFETIKSISSLVTLSEPKYKILPLPRRTSGILPISRTISIASSSKSC